MANIHTTVANLQKSLGPLAGQWQLWAGLLTIVLLIILKYRLTYLLTNHRWIFVIFLLPVSVCYEVFWFVRGKYVFWRRSAPKQHDKRVAYVQQQIKEWNAAGRKALMCTARPSWLTMSITHGKYKKTHRAIEINLADVLEVDTRKKTVRVEPLCTMGQISATLLPLGWTLPVVPELDDLTVGGVINGVGVETSSHKYGLFCETCVAYELVLADGSFVRCSPDENPELFYAVPWSHGTLGFLVAAEINIVPAKKYVRVQYFPTQTRDAGVHLFTKACRDKSNDFVEALMYNENQMVTMIGHYTDQPESGKVNSIGHYYKPWFYKHVETFLKSKPTSNGNPAAVEYLPLRHYYHRHTRSIFWELSDIVPFGNHPLWRYTLGWTMPPKISLLKLTTTGAIRELYENHHVTQDFLVPISTLADSLKVMHQDFLVYPLWICPFKISEPGRYRPFCRPLPGDELYVDVGAYGVPKNPAFVAKPTVRKVEEFVRRVKGYQMLYADSYMTRQEFREMFDHSMYDALRKKLKCEDAFPEVYDKVSKEART